MSWLICLELSHRLQARKLKLTLMSAQQFPDLFTTPRFSAFKFCILGLKTCLDPSEFYQTAKIILKHLEASRRHRTLKAH